MQVAFAPHGLVKHSSISVENEVLVQKVIMTLYAVKSVFANMGYV